MAILFMCSVSGLSQVDSRTRFVSWSTFNSWLTLTLTLSKDVTVFFNINKQETYGKKTTKIVKRH